MSTTLLPALYASGLALSLASLEGMLGFFRELLNAEDNDGEEGSIDDTASPVDSIDREEDEGDGADLTRTAYFSSRHSKESFEDELVKGRKEELEWLHDMIGGVDPIHIPRLVAHRGFHSPSDLTAARPLENSLSAYEAAWTNGVHLCECDIAVTKDERVVLAHDDNFARLALHPTRPSGSKTVRDMTFRELMSTPIKSGARPPLLFDVLRSAATIGGDARMVVEIKTGNMEAATSLARMFARHPRLMDRVAVVMSFDAFIMHDFGKEMAVVYDRLGVAPPRQQHQLSQASPHPRERFGHVGQAVIATNRMISGRLRSNTLGSSVRRRSTMMGGLRRVDSGDLFGLGASVGGFDATPGATEDWGEIESFPKLLLLTVNHTEHRHHQFGDFTRPDAIAKLLRDGDGGSLDGVYLQYQEDMITPGGCKALRDLAARYYVGVWGSKDDPDDWDTFLTLVDEGHVSYVNSDLPRHFRRKKRNSEA
jgi:glycerophosphoryl diester phosphodiesterase